MKFSARKIIVSSILVFVILLVSPSISARAEGIGDLEVSSSQEFVGPVLFRLGELPSPMTQEGTIVAISGEETTVHVEIFNNPEKVWVFDGDKSYELQYDPLIGLWFGFIEHNYEGYFQLSVKIKLQNGQIHTKQINDMYVYKSGSVVVEDELNNLPAEVKLYYRKDRSNDWILWNGAEVGQNNPVFTNEEGDYSFLLDKGEYYLEVNKSGYRSRRSAMFTLSEESIINQTIKLEEASFFDFVIQIFDNFKVNPVKISQLESPSKLLQIGSSFELNNLKQSEILYSIGSITDDNESVVSFWTTWGINTPEQINQLERLSTMSEEKGFKVLSVGIGENYQKYENFIRNRDYVLDTYIIEDYSDIKKWNILTTPYYVFLDKEGQVFDYSVGRVLSAEEILDKF